MCWKNWSKVIEWGFDMITNPLCSTPKGVTSVEINSRTLNHGCSLHGLGARGQYVTDVAVGVNMLNILFWNVALSPEVHQCFQTLIS